MKTIVIILFIKIILIIIHLNINKLKGGRFIIFKSISTKINL